MLRRIGIALLCVSALLVAADGAIAIDAWLAGGSPSRAAPVPPAGAEVDRPVPPIPLVDQNGRATTLSALRGRYVVLAPFMTLCHEVCPMTTAVLERLRRDADRQGLHARLAIVEVTVDPWRDSPERLQAYARLAGTTGIRLMTGTSAAIRHLWGFFGVYYRRVPQARPPDVDWLTGRAETFDVEHSDALFVIDPRGHLRLEDDGMPAVGGTLPARLRALLNDRGGANLARPKAPWTERDALADVRYLIGAPPAPAAVRPPTPAAAAAELAGSPAPLAALHAQAAMILAGGGRALRARLAALRGHPIVVNEWASWCPPCRSELPLFALASARLGRRIAFLGVDVEDPTGAGAAFLRSHPVSYPSFADSDGSLAQTLGGGVALPTTAFFDAAGRPAFTHIGGYTSENALTRDVERLKSAR